LARAGGDANRLYDLCHAELLRIVETAAQGDLSLRRTLWQVSSGRLFGLRSWLRRVGRDFAALRGPGELPCVELAGEIYVRGVDFSNDFLIEKLEARGLRVHLSPKLEWINYCGHVQQQYYPRNPVVDGFCRWLRVRIQAAASTAIGQPLGWPAVPQTSEVLAAARPYVNEALLGEAILTVGAPLHEWHEQRIDAVVSVGPLECMPTKIAEAQLQHVAERENLLSLTLPFNGDPISEAALDTFAFEVKERFKARRCSARLHQDGKSRTSHRPGVVPKNFSCERPARTRFSELEANYEEANPD
jgi:hypothetical protein